MQSTVPCSYDSLSFETLYHYNIHLKYFNPPMYLNILRNNFFPNKPTLKSISFLDNDFLEQ